MDPRRRGELELELILLLLEGWVEGVGASDDSDSSCSPG